jgi:hypothetical protein
MEILSRVRPAEIGAARYRSFLSNDEAAALQYALDGNLLRRNGAAADDGALMLDVQGELPPSGADTRIVIEPEMPLGISAARVIGQKLGISQSAARRMAEEGLLVCDADIRKKKLCESVSFDLRTGWDG